MSNQESENNLTLKFLIYNFFESANLSHDLLKKIKTEDNKPNINLDTAHHSHVVHQKHTIT